MSDDQHSMTLEVAIELFKPFRRMGSRPLLAELGEKMILGQDFDFTTREYIGFALLDLSEGLSVTKAFNMQPTGRPRDNHLFERDLRIALDVSEKMRQGSSYEQASYDVAELHNVSDSTAEKAYKRFAHRFKAIHTIEQLRSFRESLDRPKR